MAASLVTDQQRRLLKAIGRSTDLAGRYYLTGGTALAGFYLQHRHSEDLDFFSEQEFDVADLNVFWRSISRTMGITSIDFQHSFNRNLFFLQLDGQTLKTEFTYFPFPRIEPGSVQYGVTIDSLIDIAVNKLFTIYQQPRARDYIDLFCICQERPIAMSNLIALARNKFEQSIDPIQLGTQFIKSREVKDYPRLVKKITPQDWHDFFRNEAKKLKTEVLDET